MSFYRQAVDLYVKIGKTASEGGVRNNLADALRQLGRLPEARAEVLRAIECRSQFGHAAQIWTSWTILAQIETDAGNREAAAQARTKAIVTYLAYRRNGGENHYPDGRLALAVTQTLQSTDPAEAQALLAQVAADPDLPDQLAPFVQALQQICASSHDPALADDPALDYTMAAEILLLIETLPP